MGQGRAVARKGRTTSRKSSLRKVEQEPDVVHGGGKVILLGVAKKPESKMTTFEKITLVDHGIPKKDLERLKEVADLDYDQLAKVLSVTRATLINKKGEERFNTTVSEKILSIADIYSYGFEVFEDDKRFNEWIFRPNKALGGHAPYDLMDTQFGREEIKNLIGRIDYGVYS